MFRMTSAVRKSRHVIALFFLARQPPVGQGLLIYEVSGSHTTTEGLLWTSDQPDAENVIALTLSIFNP